jgi:hypothetical protein
MITTEDNGLDLVAWTVVRRHVHTGTIPGAMSVPKLLYDHQSQHVRREESQVVKSAHL